MDKSSGLALHALGCDSVRLDNIVPTDESLNDSLNVQLLLLKSYKFPIYLSSTLDTSKWLQYTD